MVGQTEPDYVMVAEEGSDDIMELPQEKDGTVLLSTVKAQFPNAIGLKYKSSTGGWRGIRAADNILDPPGDGWGEITYFITESNALKRKSIGDNTGRVEKKSSRSPSLLEDMIVLGVPYSTTEDELKKYFTDSCGEVAFHELKHERDTGKSRGFGFIRFQTEEGAKEALNGQHYIQGRQLKVRLSKKKEDTPAKLFVRLPGGTTHEDVDAYFSEFGELVDVFVPNPFRGFGFITYASQDDAANVLRMDHVMKGARMNVTAAAPKEPKVAEKPDNIRASNWNDSRPNWNANNHPSDNWSAPPVQTSRYQEPPVQKDVASELKDMLLTLIQGRN